MSPPNSVLKGKAWRIGLQFASVLKMKRKALPILTILILSLFLVYQILDLNEYINQPRAVKLDDRIEEPQTFEIEETETSENKSDQKNQTKPMKKLRFLKTQTLSDNRNPFTKEDYLVMSGTKKKAFYSHLESNWQKKVLNSESVIEKSLTGAAEKAAHMNGGAMEGLSQQNLPKPMEIYALKVALPTSKEGTKFKLQYREPPKFGKANLPEPNLPDVSEHKERVFTIEKTTASESPWNNFQNLRYQP